VTPAGTKDFLTGAGKYADDMNLPGKAYAYMVRSPQSRARIAGIDIGRRPVRRVFWRS